MKNQRRIVLTPKTRTYFDYLQHSSPKQNAYWPLQRPAPNARWKAVTLQRVFGLHSVNSRFVRGVSACLWSELITAPAIARYQLLPRLFALADAGWTARSGSVDAAFPAFERRAQRALLLFAPDVAAQNNLV